MDNLTFLGLPVDIPIASLGPLTWWKLTNTLVCSSDWQMATHQTVVRMLLQQG